jgi:signal transduction histidine kinase
MVFLELSVSVGGGAGAVPLNTQAYVIGAVIALPLLLHHRWPVQVLVVGFATMMLYYIFARRNISPAPLLAVPVYDAAVSGYIVWAIAIPTILMIGGLIAVGSSGAESTAQLLVDFVPSIVLFMLGVALGGTVRGRRLQAEDAAERLRLVDEERRADAARLVAEERLRIARELHDTVAHSMATITVQASSALLEAPQGPVLDALTAIRQTSKDALTQMRGVLGQLRGSGDSLGDLEGMGLARLDSLRAAVEAAGSPVDLLISGERLVLPPAVDHAAYRILQESLTNVLRHAPPGTPAKVALRYLPDLLTITVSNSADALACVANGGNGLRGMAERATAVGGSLDAGPAPDGGFRVTAKLPVPVGGWA